MGLHPKGGSRPVPPYHGTRRGQPHLLSLSAAGAARAPWNLQLLAALVRRDFKAQYRRSLIGPAWAILYSGIYLLLFIAIRSFLGIPSDGKPYAIFAAVAIVPWTFFAGRVTRAGARICLNAPHPKMLAVRRGIFSSSPLPR